jgi:DNA-binding NtrC family response regulator
MGPQSPNRSNLYAKKVLLIDRCQATREARTAVLQSRGLEVRAAESLSDARFLWQPNQYDLVLLDVRRYLPGQAMEFYEQVRATSPR